jgi:hypothetical protein
VEMLEKLGVPAKAIKHDGVVVIAERAGQQNIDLVALRGFDQAIGESVVRVDVGPKQELPLRAAAGDHVELTQEHLTR